MEYKDYYKILGVTKQSTEKEIKTAYRKLARKYHPDTNPAPSAEDRFKEINEAYEVLGDDEKRQQYNQLGSNYHRWQQSGGGGGFSDFMNNAGGGRGTGGINFEDIFSNGGGFGGNSAGGFADIFSMFNGGAGNGYSRQPQPQNIVQKIHISLEEAYHGTSRTLLSGSGERFTARIPAGVKTGQKIRHRGKGKHGGDLHLQITVRDHAIYTRTGADEADLETVVQVDVLTAVLGGTVTVQTLKGEKSLKIMPNTSGGRKVRLKGYGMPKRKEKGSFGNLVVVIQLVVPAAEELSDEERSLYERLRSLQA